MEFNLMEIDGDDYLGYKMEFSGMWMGLNGVK